MYGFVRRIQVTSFVFLISLLIAIAPLGARAASTDTGLIWKVTSGNATAYVVGSYPICLTDVHPLPEAMDAAFTESEVLVTQMDSYEVERERLPMLLHHARLPEKTYLPQVVSRQTFIQLMMHGVELREISGMRPWFVAVILNLEAYNSIGYSPGNPDNPSMEQDYEAKAMERGMSKKVLETVEDMFEQFYLMDQNLEEQFLRCILRELDDCAEQMEKGCEYWRKGDVDSWERMHLKSLEGYPELARYFHDSDLARSERVCEGITAFLEDGRTHFVILTPELLIGEQGVPYLLKKRGYEVEQVTNPSEI